MNYDAAAVVDGSDEAAGAAQAAREAAAREAASGAGGDIAEAQRLARATLRICLEQGFRLLHPMMPFVTEELWQRLPGRGLPYTAGAGGVPDPESICIAPYPTPIAALAKPDVEAAFLVFQSVVRAGRTLRADADLVPSKFAVFYIIAGDKAAEELMCAQSADVKTLLRASELTILSASAGGAAQPQGCSAAVVSEALTIYIQLKGLVDPTVETAKLTKKRFKLEKEAEDVRKRRDAAGFEQKVPKEVRDAMAEQLGAAEAQIKVIEDLIKQYASWTGTA